MKLFAYQARDSSGKILSGVQEAVSEDNAINALMTRGLMVLSIQQKAGGKVTRRLGKITETDLVLFTRQLATMIDAGLPLMTGLTALFEQADPKKQAGLQRVIGELIARVQEGDSFNEAISKHPKVFNRLYISMVKAGESGGLLAEVLDRLATFLEETARLHKKVKSALTYPVVVVCIAICITTFLIVKVVPVFGSIFSDFGAKLPAPTQFLMDLSDFIRSEWWLLILIIIGAIMGVRYFLRSDAGSKLWDRWKLKMPVFGDLMRKICMTRFARTFAQLIRSGVPILEVMDIVGETSGNYVIAQAIKSVRDGVEKGDHLTSAMSRQTIFPPMMLRMVAAGESTGKIDAMLEKMADFWDEEIEATLDALTSLIEPIMIVVLGAIVGGIVVAMFMPIFKLNEIVNSGKG
jgi:type IV pilus assembly protein PilC